MWVTLNLRSKNKKVGQIPVSTTEKDSCPKECPLKDTDCYARFGPLGIHWSKVKERGTNWPEFCGRIAKFAVNTLWRHNQAGDLPQNSRGKLHKPDCMKLAKASSHTNGWTYTHYDPTDSHNRDTIAAMNKIGGLTVNLSADSLTEADEYVQLGIGPVVVTLPNDENRPQLKTPAGNPIVICPAQTSDLTCEQCCLCQIQHRKSIVGFLAHGTAQKRLSEKLKA